MSLDPKGSTTIERVDLYPTPLWMSNIGVNTQQERKVSLNESTQPTRRPFPAA